MDFLSGYLVLLAIFCVFTEANGYATPWSWRCDDSDLSRPRCLKELKVDANQGSLEKCKLTCGPFGSLWPRPTTATLGKSVSYFLPMNSEVVIESNPAVFVLLTEAYNLAIENINKYHPNYTSENDDYWVGPWDVEIEKHRLIIDINVEGSEEYLTLNTSESYSLTVSETKKSTTVEIGANTFFGARHALETFTQLVDFEHANNALQIINMAEISDAPTYPYRGISLDTSRNFIPVADLKRTLDAMSFNKLNTLHWHLSDTHSFPLDVPTLPNMAYFGAYTPLKTYTAQDIKNLVQYARVRGIRMLPELDAPAHVGSGWQWGPSENLGDLVVCFDQEPWSEFCLQPPCGQLNLANPKIYDVIQVLYKELLEMFSPVDLFHFGGDEINLNCWNTTNEILVWMIAKGNSLSSDDYYGEWSFFQEKVRSLLQAENGGQSIPGILWTSALTDAARIEESLDKEKYIIQIWTSGKDQAIEDLLEKGYRVIFSNYDAWYLDCGFGSWVGEGHNWCSPFKGWKDVYANSPLEIVGGFQGNYTNQIVGGEAPLWTEQADWNNLDSRLWPRGSALAERLWAEPSSTWHSAEFRMIHHRERIVQRGIRADGEQPEWCHQNDGTCYV